MSGKLSSVVIVFGCAFILLGLSFLPAAFSHDHDQTILGAAICAISFGFLSVAAGFYLKTRLLQSAASAGPKKAPSKPVRGGCDLCFQLARWCEVRRTLDLQVSLSAKTGGTRVHRRALAHADGPLANVDATDFR